jgi:hypothetical protein
VNRNDPLPSLPMMIAETALSLLLLVAGLILVPSGVFILGCRAGRFLFPFAERFVLTVVWLAGFQ